MLSQLHGILFDGVIIHGYCVNGGPMAVQTQPDQSWHLSCKTAGNSATEERAARESTLRWPVRIPAEAPILGLP